MDQFQSPALSDFLKGGTQDLHDKLDKRVMQLQPFADSAHYQGFLRMQLRLHSAVEPLYQSEAFEHLSANMKLRSRLNAVLADCYDLNIPIDLQHLDQQSGSAMHLTALYDGFGWLYTVEGSTLGAAMLLKHVKHKLELSENFGAHHMAAHADGRATHWREFKSMLDSLELTETQKQQALQGAISAFQYATECVDKCMVETVSP